MNLIERLRACRGFDWDQGNSGKNFAKHSISDSEAEQVFFNQPLVAVLDAKHSQVEERFHVLGKTDGGRALLVVATIRGDLIRVISARPMSRKERKVYEHHE